MYCHITIDIDIDRDMHMHIHTYIIIFVYLWFIGCSMMGSWLVRTSALWQPVVIMATFGQFLPVRMQPGSGKTDALG
jgi:hypothetical protein